MSCCPKKETIICEESPAAIGPYSVAVSAGDFVFISGQLGIDKETGNLVSGGIQEQTRKALENMKKILKSAGLGLEDVVKTTVFLQDMGDFAQMNAVYAEYFTRDFPARSAIKVGALPKSGLVEIEAIALNSTDQQDQKDCCHE